MLKRTSLISCVAVAAVFGATVPALADDQFGSVDCAQNPQPSCQLDAGQGGHTGEGASGHGGTIHVAGDGADSGNNGVKCRYVPVDYQSPGGQPAGPGSWFMVLCSPDGKDPLSHGPVWVADGAGGAPVLSPAELAQMARQRLRLPEPRIAASPAGDQLVNLPTWLWLSSGWAPVSASASVPGVSVTAVAKPTSVSWSMGDGGTVDCAGSGTPYRVGVDPRSASPDCGYVYRRSSSAQPGHAFAVTATVGWTISWSGAGQSGAFPGLTTSATTSYRVAEAQALGTG